MSKQEKSKKQEEHQDDVTFYGEIAWFNKKKDNYGFITPEDKQVGDDDVFVHGSQVVADSDGKIPELNPGDEVTFILADPPEGNKKKKPMAKEVKLVKKAEKKSE